MFYVAFGEKEESGTSPWPVPFLLDSSAEQSGSRFCLRSIHTEGVFVFTLELNNERILFEQLEYSPMSSRKNSFRLLYQRIWNQDNKTYQWSNGSHLGSEYIAIQHSFNKTTSFATLLLQNFDIEILRNWKTFYEASALSIFVGQEGVTQYKAVSGLLALEKMPSQDAQLSKILLTLVVNLLQRFDVGIHGVEVTRNKKTNIIEVWAIHKNNKGESVRWRWEEESAGTQRLLACALNINVILGMGSVLLIDELGANVHPAVTREIIKLFQSEKTNPKRAQLLFTSHDNTLQRGNLLRRDQIWLTQKRDDGSTDLYSVADFKVRNDLALDKAYLDGRFGAVPRISDDFSLGLNEEQAEDKAPEIAGV